MAWTKLPLPIQIYKPGDESQLPSQIGARLVNGYIDEFGHIRKRPGLTEIADLAGTKVNGLYWWDKNANVIAVVSGNIYRITSVNGNNSDVTGDQLGTTEIVSFAEGDGTALARTLAMANGGEIVVYTNTGTADNLTSTGSGTPPSTVSHVAFLDGYLLATDIATDGRVQFSSPLNIMDWSDTDIFTAETKQSAIQFLDTRWDEITIFGKEGVDVYYNNGSTPFSKLAGAYSDRGTIAKNSVQMINSGWMFLDDKRRVATLAGRQIVDLSTPFDNDIRNITPVSSGESMDIEFGPRKFYILTFPDEDRTFVYDRSTNGWAEWGTWDGISKYTRFTGTVSTYAKDWDVTLVGDKSNGKVYKVDNNNFQDGDTNIRLLVRTGHVDYGTGNRKRSLGMRLRMRRGTGTLSVDDKVSIRWRDNNGPWSSWHPKSLGIIGDNDFYVRFGPMGMYRSRQYELAHSANSDFILIDWEENIEDLGR